MLTSTQTPFLGKDLQLRQSSRSVAGMKSLPKNFTMKAFFCPLQNKYLIIRPSRGQGSGLEGSLEILVGLLSLTLNLRK